MEKAIGNSKLYFDSGYGCAESVLKAFAEFKGIESGLIPRIATGFCGGMAHTDGLCGAYTGAVLALNMVLGRDRADQSKEENYVAIHKFTKKFREKFGHITCKGLTGVDLGSDEGHHRYQLNQMHSECTVFVGESTRLVMELLSEIK